MESIWIDSELEIIDRVKNEIEARDIKKAYKVLHSNMWAFNFNYVSNVLMCLGYLINGIDDFVWEIRACDGKTLLRLTQKSLPENNLGVLTSFIAMEPGDVLKYPDKAKELLCGDIDVIHNRVSRSIKLKKKIICEIWDKSEKVVV